MTNRVPPMSQVARALQKHASRELGDSETAFVQVSDLHRVVSVVDHTHSVVGAYYRAQVTVYRTIAAFTRAYNVKVTPYEIEITEWMSGASAEAACHMQADAQRDMLREALGANVVVG